MKYYKLILLLNILCLIYSCTGCKGGERAKKKESNLIKKESGNNVAINSESLSLLQNQKVYKGDSILFNYLDSAIEKKYELWATYGNNVINPYFEYIKDSHNIIQSILFKEPKTGKIHRRINYSKEDNPFIKEGFKIHKTLKLYNYLEAPDGVNTNKKKIKKYLPSYLYEEIPIELKEGLILNFNVHESFQNGYLITSHTFEVEGIHREWIHGDYATSRHLVYDTIGNLIYDYWADSEDATVKIDPTGKFLIAIKNYNTYYFDTLRQKKSKVEIINLSNKKLVFGNEITSYNWNYNFVKYGYTLLFQINNINKREYGLSYVLNPFKSYLIPMTTKKIDYFDSAIEKNYILIISMARDSLVTEIVNPLNKIKL